MKTLQEWFNDAYSGLASQSFKRSIRGEDCLYQSEVGCCAIGWGIPKESREAADIALMTLGQVLLFVKEDNSLINYLDELRELHDSSSSPSLMRRKLIDYASKYNLMIPS
jgi:hypothetical protein